MGRRERLAFSRSRARCLLQPGAMRVATITIAVAIEIGRPGAVKFGRPWRPTRLHDDTHGTAENSSRECENRGDLEDPVPWNRTSAQTDERDDLQARPYGREVWLLARRMAIERVAGMMGAMNVVYEKQPYGSRVHNGAVSFPAACPSGSVAPINL